MSVREKAIDFVNSSLEKQVEKYKALAERNKGKNKDKADLYRDVAFVLDDILHGDNLPQESEYDDLLCAVIDLLTLLESKTMSVDDAIEESEIRKYL